MQAIYADNAQPTREDSVAIIEEEEEEQKSRHDDKEEREKTPQRTEYGNLPDFDTIDALFRDPDDWPMGQY